MLGSFYGISKSTAKSTVICKCDSVLLQILDASQKSRKPALGGAASLSSEVTLLARLWQHKAKILAR
jgi:hypothetical protein